MVISVRFVHKLPTKAMSICAICIKCNMKNYAKHINAKKTDKKAHPAVYKIGNMC